MSYYGLYFKSFFWLLWHRSSMLHILGLKIKISTFYVMWNPNNLPWTVYKVHQTPIWVTVYTKISSTFQSLSKNIYSEARFENFLNDINVFSCDQHSDAHPMADLLLCTSYVSYSRGDSMILTFHVFRTQRQGTFGRL